MPPPIAVTSKQPVFPCILDVSTPSLSPTILGSPSFWILPKESALPPAALKNWPENSEEISCHLSFVLKISSGGSWLRKLHVYKP